MVGISTTKALLVLTYSADLMIAGPLVISNRICVLNTWIISNSFTKESDIILVTQSLMNNV